MQIFPLPPSAWSNPAAAAQQASEQQRTAPGAKASAPVPPLGIDGIERPGHTTDRDADGHSEEPLERRPRPPEEVESNPRTPLLELPAEEGPDDSTLDLLG